MLYFVLAAFVHGTVNRQGDNMNNRQSTGNEKYEQHGFPGRPSASPFTHASPFAPAPQTMPPFISSRPSVGADSAGQGTGPQPRFNGPTIPPPQSSYAPTDVGFSPRMQTPQFPPARPGPPMAPSPFLSSVNQQPMSPSAPFRPQPYIPSVPMRPPPQNMNPTLSRGTTPSPASPPLQSAAQGYVYRQPDPITTQVPPPLAPPVYGHQGGYAPPPPPSGMNMRDQLQPPPGGPPMGTLQGLVEEFSSLSVGSVPGSIDPGVDAKTLPRPLEGDVLPKAFSEMYPLNCDPRFLRLTTSAIPNSQSLISRWHLPLGAVVHPLAESVDGVSNTFTMLCK